MPNPDPRPLPYHPDKQPVLEVLPPDWPVRLQMFLIAAQAFIGCISLGAVVWLAVAFIQDRAVRIQLQARQDQIQASHEQSQREAKIARDRVYEQLQAMNRVLEGAILDNRTQIEQNSQRVDQIEGVVGEVVGEDPRPVPAPNPPEGNPDAEPKR